jgi:hypothetical protein
MSEHDHDMPVPPASFDFLVASLVMQAQVHLGLLHFGDDEPPQADIPLARHSIDLLAMLQDKTRGNLDLAEQRQLENSLTELRFRYVQALENAAKPEPDPQTQPAPTPDADSTRSEEGAPGS